MENQEELDFLSELIDTFLLEFEELMDLYRKSLSEIRKPHGDHDQAYEDLFRIYHTLKGDAGYFPEFEDFTKFASHYCELLRPRDSSVKENDQLLRELSLNYSRLSTALAALKKGKSLQTFRFKLFLKNF